MNYWEVSSCSLHFLLSFVTCASNTEIRPNRLRLFAEGSPHVLCAAVQPKHQLFIFRLCDSLIASQVECEHKNREPRGRFCQLLFLIHYSEGHGRHSVHDCWQFCEVLERKSRKGKFVVVYLHYLILYFVSLLCFAFRVSAILQIAASQNSVSCFPVT